MRTKLFRDMRVIPEKFLKHLGICSDFQVPESVKNNLASLVWQYQIAPTARDEEKVLDELTSLWPLSPDGMEALLRIGSYFLGNVGTEDTFEAVIDDLGVVTQLGEAQIEKLRPLLSLFVDEAHKQHLSKEVLSTQGSGLKMVRGITRLADLRAVVINRDKLDEDPEQYEPKISALVPVGILRLSFGKDESLVFQLDLHTLDIFMSELIGLKKEIDALVAAVPEEMIQKGRR